MATGLQLLPALGAFSELATTWDACNRERCDNHPLLDSRFVAPLVCHFAGEHTRVAVLPATHRCPEMLLCSPRSPFMWASYLPGQAPISPHMVSRAELFDQLLRQLPWSPLAFCLYCQDPEHSPFRKDNQVPVHEFTPHSLTTNIRISGSFEDYWQGRSKKLRQNVGRYQRRAEKDGIALRLEIIDDAPGVAAAVMRYGEMESRGWKGEAGTAIHANNVQGRFYRDILKNFSTTGNAAVYELYFNDRLAASRLTISNAEMLIMLKTSYEEEFSKCAPGRLLLRLLLQLEFERRRYRRIEFYTNAAPDLVAWATHTRVISHVMIYRSVAVRRSFAGYRAVRNRFKALTKAPIVD